MKRYSDLFEKVIDIENLRLAEQKARHGKEKRPEVRAFDNDKDAHLQRLHDILAAGEYHTSQYHVFKIMEPKERYISKLPYYPDRIVHHAIMNVLEPIWVATFTTDCYACIKDRGIHACAKAIRRAIDTDKYGTRYYLQTDINKYYPSIDHGKMKAVVRRKIKDERLLALIDEIIDSADGLPIGNYLSQYLANLYLAYFDHKVKEELGVQHYFRYADDMLFFGTTKEELHKVLDYATAYLRDELGLTIKGNWKIRPTETGIDMVGFVFYQTHTRLRKGIKKNLVHRISQLEHRKTIPAKKDYLQALASWWGWIKYSDSRHLLRTINTHTTYEIKF